MSGRVARTRRRIGGDPGLSKSVRSNAATWLPGTLHRALVLTVWWSSCAYYQHVFTRTCQFHILCLLDPDYFMYLWDNL